MNTRAFVLALAGAAAFALAAAHANADTLALARLALCGGALAIAAATDLAEHRIPNRVVLPAATICAVLALAGNGLRALAWGLAVVALLLLVSLARPAALGMGDVKLALLIAVGLDGRAPTAFILGVLVAALAGLGLLILRGHQAWRHSLPLAPFLAAGALGALLV
jgi:leader peptidase (prepilin peptidase) / N-methyltransferase